MRKPALELLVRLPTQSFPPIRLLAAIALFAASTVSIHAQTAWTGAVSSNWFVRGNWNAGVPLVVTTATIDNPNPTVIASPGATAQNLFVGQAGTGMLTIQTAGTLINLTGTVGSLPGSNGTVTVTGAGSTWSNLGSLVVGDAGTGTLTIDNGGTVISAFGNLAVGQAGTGALKIQNGGTLTNIGGFLGNLPGVRRQHQ